MDLFSFKTWKKMLRNTNKVQENIFCPIKCYLFIRILIFWKERIGSGKSFLHQYLVLDMLRVGACLFSTVN
jgi:hypothetical protein